MIWNTISFLSSPRKQIHMNMFSSWKLKIFCFLKRPNIVSLLKDICLPLDCPQKSGQSHSIFFIVDFWPKNSTKLLKDLSKELSPSCLFFFLFLQLLYLVYNELLTSTTISLHAISRWIIFLLILFPQFKTISSFLCYLRKVFWFFFFKGHFHAFIQ